MTTFSAISATHSDDMRHMPPEFVNATTLEEKNHVLHELSNAMALESDHTANHCLETIHAFGQELQHPSQAALKHIFCDGIKMVALYSAQKNPVFIPAIAFILKAAETETNDNCARLLYIEAGKVMAYASKDVTPENWAGAGELVLDAIAVERENKLGQADLLACFIENCDVPFVLTPAMDCKLAGLKTQYGRQVVEPEPMQLMSQQQIYTTEIIAALGKFQPR